MDSKVGIMYRVLREKEEEEGRGRGGQEEDRGKLLELERIGGSLSFWNEFDDGGGGGADRRRMKKKRTRFTFLGESHRKRAIWGIRGKQRPGKKEEQKINHRGGSTKRKKKRRNERREWGRLLG